LFLFLSAFLFSFFAFRVIRGRENNSPSSVTNSVFETPKPKFVLDNSPVFSTLAPTPSPTQRPLSFDEMNKLFGPCVRLPVLMYHHIQSKESAREDHQTSLTVYTDYFEGQMKYLSDKGYKVISMSDLVNFFDSGVEIPKNSVLLTFDDAYEDFYLNAYPILQKFNFKATVFVPTGLVSNAGYLTWDEMDSMKDLVLFANHTWSHKNVKSNISQVEYEISTADSQLKDHLFNSPKIFAYPYGIDSLQAEKYLNSLGYKAAFTTRHGNILCKGQRLDLPRIRIGNAPLSSYGF
jgi:peptidoglycan/xylan/chitin deacetylase (PgdA/CDA1 family)